MLNLIRKPQAVIGLVFALFLLFVAVFAPVIAPNLPDEIHATRYAEPSEEFPMGTDQLGRCVFSRLVYGASYSLGIALPALLGLAVIGLFFGATTAYHGGIIDRIFVVLCDIFMAFPAMLIAMSLIGALGNSVTNIILSVVISMWAWFVRMVRGLALVEVQKDYVIAAKISGAQDIHILLNHIIPNVFPHFVVFLAIGVSNLIIMISSFSFLGLGLPVGTAEWGSMMNDARSSIYSAPELIILPGICIAFAALSFTLLGESFRDTNLGEDKSV